MAKSTAHYAVGRHNTVKVLPNYTKRTIRQIENAVKKRRASRTGRRYRAP